MHATPLADFAVIGRYRDFALLILGAAGFLLLIVAANVGNLLLAQTTGRQKELALRSAIGATRGRIIRQILTESMVLAGFGCMAGLLVAMWGVRLIQTSMPAEAAKQIAGWNSIAVNGSALGFSVALACITGLVSGLIPAIRSSGSQSLEYIRSGSRAIGASGEGRSRTVMVASQVCLGLVLLVGSSLTIKGLNALLVLKPDLDPEHVLTFRVDLNSANYDEVGPRQAFWRDALTRLQAVPSVSHVGLSSSLPYQLGGRREESLAIEGRDAIPGESPKTRVVSAAGAFYEALRIPLLEGRTFHDGDTVGMPTVAVVNHAFAAKFFGAQSPVGRRVRLQQSNDWMEIVGVVGDIRDLPFDRAIAPTLYRPVMQTIPRELALVLRTSSSPQAIVPEVRKAMLEVGPREPLFNVSSFDDVISERVTGFRYLAALMTFLGFVALVLVSLGVYAVTSQTTTERTREVGIRIALGASGRDVVRSFTFGIMRSICIALSAGLVLSVALVQVLANQIFGVSTTDAGVFAFTAIALAIVALLACYIPARRAAHVDPINCLRAE